MRLAIFFLLAFSIAACDSGEGESIYDPDAPIGATPVIASITPSDVVLAGVDEIVIRGENFSATPSQNQVFFADGAGAGAPGAVLSATPTELRVKVPNLPNDALRVQVAVQGARNLSNAIPFPLTPAFVTFGEITSSEVPFGIAADADGTLYLSLSDNGTPLGVTRISPDGVRDPSPYFASSFPWPGLARAGDRLIGVRRVRAVFELPEGGSQRVVSAFQPSSLSLSAVSKGADGSIFVGGNEPTLFRIASDGSTSETPFPATVRALAFTAGTLYVVSGSSEDAPSRVYTVAVLADGTLGTATVIGDLPGDGTAIAVAADGTLFVGLNRTTDPIVLMTAGGTATPLYPGVIAGPATALAYGAGSQLYMVRGASGDNAADLLRIETRTNGAP